MKKESVVLGTVAAVCVILLVTALVMRRGGGAGSAPAPAGVVDGTPDAAAGAPGPEGAVPAGAATPTGAPGEAAATPSPTPEAPSFTSEQNRRDVTLFFEQVDDESLAPEKRKIFLTSSPLDQAKQIVVELINGPHSQALLPTMPPETRLLGLYLDRHGTAYVDLSEELVTQHSGGSSEELATIFSLVDSLTYNLPEIKRVHFLIAGEERDTLNSHLDLRRDYRQDLSIVDMDRRSDR